MAREPGQHANVDARAAPVLAQLGNSNRRRTYFRREVVADVENSHPADEVLKRLENGVDERRKRGTLDEDKQRSNQAEHQKNRQKPELFVLAQEHHELGNE